MFSMLINSKRRYHSTLPSYVPPGGWRHIEVSLDSSNELRIFINGELRNSENVPFAITPGTGPVFIARYRIEDGNGLVAHMQNFRLTKGSAVRNTANFIPTPFDFGPSNDPRWSDVEIALAFDGVDGATTFVDDAGGIWTSSLVQLDDALTLIGSTSLDIPSDGYLRKDYDVATELDEPWTLDFWLYQASYGAAGRLCSFGQINAVHAGEWIEVNGDGTITVYLFNVGWPSPTGINVTTDDP